MMGRIKKGSRKKVLILTPYETDKYDGTHCSEKFQMEFDCAKKKTKIL